MLVCSIAYNHRDRRHDEQQQYISNHGRRTVIALLALSSCLMVVRIAPTFEIAVITPMTSILRNNNA
jgi:hypothetical protein